MHRVLVVEDDRDVANLLIEGLRDLADRVDHSPDGQGALAMAETADYALIALDLMLPRLGGLKICELLRSSGADAALLAVTGRPDLVASRLGTRLGFDDYVLKPFDMDEVRAKAQRLLERRRCLNCASNTAPASLLELEGLSLHPATQRVEIDGKPVEGLSSKEFNLVYLLARNPEASFSKEELLAALWGIYHPLSFRYLGIDVSRVRDKLKSSSSDKSCLSITPDDRYVIRPPARRDS